MKILITGAKGFIGSRLTEILYENGYDDIRVLTRNKEKLKKNTDFPIEIFQWNPEASQIDSGALENVDAVIHLAGESIAEGKWTEEKKKKLVNSRINGAKLLLQEISKLQKKPQKFISSSAIGYYGNRGDEVLNENSQKGTGFLPDLCSQWEELSLSHEFETMNSCVVRTGIVLGAKGGALAKMLLPFSLGVGGRLGNGKQYMSWIFTDDLVNIFIHLIKNQKSKGVYNGTSPLALTNEDFTKALGKALNRPTVFPVPSFVLKTIFGEMSQILLDGQRVVPSKLKEERFNFKFENLDDCLKHVLRHYKEKANVVTFFQWIDRPKNEVFQFFSDDKNLERITPENLKFSVESKSTKEIEKGTIINYKLCLIGIPFSWQTIIDEFKKEEFFVDRQVKGPYKKWYHTHSFFETKGGTLIKDHIIYKEPFGLLGRMLAGRFIAKDIRNIFSYRKKVLSEIFSTEQK